MSASAQVTAFRDAKHGFSPEEWEARLDLAAAYRLAARFSWHDMLGYHFSLRVPGTIDRYLLNLLGSRRTPHSDTFSISVASA